MAQRITLQLNGRSSEAIQAQVFVAGGGGSGSATGALPSPTAVIEQYQTWRAAYLALGRGGRKIMDVESVDRVGGALRGYASGPQGCEQAAKQVRQSFNQWLRASEFISVRDVIVEALNRSIETQFVVCTDNHSLQQLPWVLWDLLGRYPQVEVAISALTYRDRPHHFTFPIEPGPVQVLAILGDSKGINVQTDRQFLSALPNAEVTFLPTPQRTALHNDLWDRPRDILFFAGHSQSHGDSGTLRINEKDLLSLEDIHYALSRVARHGLTLAIFNSCDGLGLARHLAQTLLPTSIPYIIVMREAVPDAVAQAFLKHFLAAFSQGEAFHTAVRSARERLENTTQSLPPYGEWMPVIWQNPLVEPPVWPQAILPADEKKTPPALPVGQSAKKAPVPLHQRLFVGAGIAAGIIGLRFFGLLQGIELGVYDWLVRSRPADPVDKTMLIVTLTEDDISSDSAFSISDRNLEQLLNRIYQGQPHMVGLDLFRDDGGIGAEHEQLKTYFSDGDNLITICGVRGAAGEIEPSPDANPDGVGFSDLAEDKDRVVRRHLLSMSKEPGKCSTDFAFSTLLAYNYLLKTHPGFTESFQTGSWTLGTLTIPWLRLHDGAYQRQDMRGDTVLLNYRIPPTPAAQPFKTVTLSEMMDGQVPAELIKDRIVLVGKATALEDTHSTPFLKASGTQRQMFGVMIHAHAISQLVDAFVGDRPLLRPWHPLADCAWIVLWSGVGSLLAWHTTRLRYLLAAGSIAVIVVIGSSWMSLVWVGIWISPVPPVLAGAGAMGASWSIKRMAAHHSKI